MRKLIERQYGVWLKARRVGTLNQRGDYTWFGLDADYSSDPHREILGLIFEEDLGARHASALRLPAWFSNLLPEGRLREWVALDRGVPVEREVELLAQVGRDLPGAVRVLDEGQVPTEPTPLDFPTVEGADHPQATRPWRFSLAGVGMKFSMLKRDDRLTIPAFGEGGDWIVKLPDAIYRDVPRNENAMMSLAELCGISVPEHQLVSREDLPSLPGNAWMSDEDVAYVVRRFDRGADRSLIHIEDFAQVRNLLPYGDGKYAGNFETIAAIAFRTRDVGELQEFARRLAFNAAISNGDAHLKNWSLIYTNPRSPRLSPAYDIVSTGYYAETPEDNQFGLKFNKSRRFERIGLEGFRRIEDRLGARGAHLAECAEETILRACDHWSSVAPLLDMNPDLRDSIERSLVSRRRSILGR